MLDGLDEEVVPSVSVVIVSYNTREMTLECLRSIRAETNSPHELIVVDNASVDESAEKIHAEFPDICLIRSSTNYGFAKANNVAALEAKGTYLLLINPDTLVLNNAIDKIIDFARKRPEAKIWGGRTLFEDRRLNPTNCWRKMSLWSLVSQAAGFNSLFRNSAILSPENYGGWDRGNEREVDIISGCFLLIEKDFWDLLGGFDQTFVMYGEEADLCLRAKALGALPRVTPDAEIVHYMGASEKVRADKLIRLLRAKITLIKRRFAGWQQPVAVKFLFMWPFTRLIGTGILAKITKSERILSHKLVWLEVWKRRDEWSSGYPVSGPPEFGR